RRAEQGQELARRHLQAQPLQRGDRTPRREEAHLQVAAAHRQRGVRGPEGGGRRVGQRRAHAQAFRRAACVVFRMSIVITSSTLGVLAVNWPSSLYSAIWSCQIAGSIEP